MSVLATTGTVVAPGEVLYSEPLDSSSSSEAVVPGQGTYVRLVESAAASGAVERHVVALRLGLAQWDGTLVCVYPKAGATAPPLVADAAATTPPPAVDAAVAVASSSPRAATAMFGPRPGDTVHLRVTRLMRMAAAGEIIAINSAWSSGGGTLGRQEAFRGVVRVEDIRPFRPTKDSLHPPSPAEAFQPGDVVLAEVISQSDVRQYQLSTLPARCGVVEASVSVGEHGSEARRRLELIPGRRDAMACPADGAVHSRWTPLIEL